MSSGMGYATAAEAVWGFPAEGSALKTGQADTVPWSPGRPTGKPWTSHGRHAAAKASTFRSSDGGYFGEGGFFHPYIGIYRSLSIGYAADNEIRSAAASGGVLSAILIYLLGKKMIDGAVVLLLQREHLRILHKSNFLAVTPANGPENTGRFFG